jgi:hypothetical protein
MWSDGTMAKAKKPKKKKAKKKKIQERGATYLLNRMKKENPKIYDDFFAGLYASVNKAAEAAGIRPRSSGFEAIKKVWEKSSTLDQDAFFVWARPTAVKIVPIASEPIADASRCLSKTVRDFLGAWIFYKSSKIGHIMQELGFSSSDTRLSIAAKYGGPCGQEVIDALGPWLTKNGYVGFVPAIGS